MKEKVVEFIQVFFGFRKMILMLILFTVGIIFRLKGLINGSEMVDLFKNTFIAFVAGNGWEYINTSVQTYINANGQQVQDTDIQHTRTQNGA